MSNEITLEQVQELSDMLTGLYTPDGMTLANQPHLSQDEANSIIYFMQEHMHIIPSRYEPCIVCSELFDAHEAGHIVDAGGGEDEWHEDNNVTAAMLADNDGASFCSEDCERSFWLSKTNCRSNDT